jgi:hypothetical protein
MPTYDFPVPGGMHRASFPDELTADQLTQAHRQILETPARQPGEYHYSVNLGGRTVDIYTNEPFTPKEQVEAALIKFKADQPVTRAYTAVKGLGDTALDIAKSAALPTVGQIGGAALGALAGPAGALAGGAAGGAAGEWLNQQVGITEHSPWSIGIAGAGGFVAPGVAKLGQVVKQGVRNLPVLSQFLRGRALQGAERTIEGATPAGAAVDTAFDAARASAANAAPPPMQPLADKLRTITGQIPTDPGSRAYQTVQAQTDRLTEMLARPNLQMREVVNHIDDLGRSVRETDLPHLRALYGAAMDSFEQAATSGHQASGDLLYALQQARQRHAALKLDELVKSAISRDETGVAGAGQTFARGYDKVRGDIAGAFPPPVLDALDRAATRASLAPRGTGFNLRSVLLGSVGLSTHGPVGAAGGVVVDALIQGLPTAIREKLSPLTVGLLGSGYQAGAARYRGEPVSVNVGGLFSLDSSRR